ncbi:unnamed protein product [Scytosiphon promiscuus]
MAEKESHILQATAAGDCALPRGFVRAHPTLLCSATACSSKKFFRLTLSGRSFSLVRRPAARAVNRPAASSATEGEMERIESVLRENQSKKKRDAENMISSDQEKHMRSKDLQYHTRDFRQPLPKKRLTELGNIATSGDNDQIRPRSTATPTTPTGANTDQELVVNWPQYTKTVMTSAAERAVEDMLLGKPDAQAARVWFYNTKAEADQTWDAFNSATQMLRDTVEWTDSLQRDVAEAKLYSSKKYQLAKELGALAREKTKAATEATEKVVSLRQQVVHLEAKEVSAQTRRNDHDDALNQLDARYDEDERVFRCLEYNLRVSSRILESTHRIAAEQVQEQEAFDLQALLLLQHQLDNMTSSVEMLAPEIRACLSPGDAVRAVAATRAKAEALCLSLKHGLQKIADDLFAGSEGTAELTETSMPELARRITEETVCVVDQVARLEAFRLVQEAKAAKMKMGYSMVGRLRAEHESAMLDLSKCRVNLAAALTEMEAAKEDQAEADARSKRAWEQHEATLPDIEDIQSESDEAAAALELVETDVRKKREAWNKAFEARVQAQTDFDKSERRTIVWL